MTQLTLHIAGLEPVQLEHANFRPSPSSDNLMIELRLVGEHRFAMGFNEFEVEITYKLNSLYKALVRRTTSYCETCFSHYADGNGWIPGIDTILVVEEIS